MQSCLMVCRFSVSIFTLLSISSFFFFFFFNDTATTEIYTLSLHDALPIYPDPQGRVRDQRQGGGPAHAHGRVGAAGRDVRGRVGVRPRRPGGGAAVLRLSQERAGSRPAGLSSAPTLGAAAATAP